MTIFWPQMYKNRPPDFLLLAVRFQLGLHKNFLTNLLLSFFICFLSVFVRQVLFMPPEYLFEYSGGGDYTKLDVTIFVKGDKNVIFLCERHCMTPLASIGTFCFDFHLNF